MSLYNMWVSPKDEPNSYKQDKRQAVQYDWILDESIQYVGESEGQTKCKQDESNAQFIGLLPIQ